MSEKRNVPKLRFPGFGEAWVDRKLDDVFKNSRKKGKDGLPIYSVSQAKGLVPRESLDRVIQNDAKADQNLIVERGDIAYNMMRMWQGAYGISDTTCMVSPAYVVLNPRKQTLSKFFSYLFERRRSRYLFTTYSHGLTLDRLRLYPGDFLSIPIKSPSLPEQEKIAGFLTAVDRRIELLQAKRAKLEEYKKGVMQGIFSQKIRFKADDGSAFPDWEEKKLGEVAKVFSGGTPTSSKIEYYNGNIPFIRSGEINAAFTELFISDLGLEKSSAKMVTKGDLLLAIYGATSGEVGISKIDGAINQAILCIRWRGKNEFLRNWLKLNKETLTNKYLQGGQGNLSGEIVKSYIIPIPILEEQTKIAKFLTSLDSTLETLNQQITQTQEWKKGLLQGMFV